MEKLENRDLEDAEKKLEHYKEKFRKKEESGRIIISNVKRINKDFLKKMKPPVYMLKKAISQNGLNNNTPKDIELMYIVSGNEKKTRLTKGWQALLYLKK